MTDPIRLEATALAPKWAAALNAARAFAAEDRSEETIEDLIEHAAWLLVLVVLDLFDEPTNVERAAVSDAVSSAHDACEDDMVRGVAEAVLSVVRPTGSNGNVTKMVKAPWPADAMRPSPQRLSRLVRGELDGFAAAHCAGWLRAHPEECAVVRAMVRAEAAEAPRLELAAASGGHMRDPSEGEVIGTKRVGSSAEAVRIDLEAVLFRKPSPRQIAIYAGEPIAVRFEADGVTTDEIAPGYWIGAVDRTVRTTIEGKLHVGEQVVAWTIKL